MRLLLLLLVPPSAAGLQQLRLTPTCAQLPARHPPAAMRWETAQPAVLGRLAAIGALLGPAVDAVHNQALLSYAILPVALDLPLGTAKTSLLIPPLLAAAYALLGGVLPAATAALLDSPPPPPPAPGVLSPSTRAAIAVASTVCIIKSSELLVTVGAIPAVASLVLLSVACLLQWRLLDASLPSLVLATVAAIGGPIAELPLMKLGCWEYLQPDYWPLASLGLGAASPDAAWAGLSLITGPCYFAVTTDAIALGRWFASTPNSDEPPSQSARRTPPPQMREGRPVTRERTESTEPSPTGRRARAGVGVAMGAGLVAGAREGEEARVAVAPSVGCGLGAFAAEPVSAGSFVCLYHGERLSRSQASARYSDADAEYLFCLGEDTFFDAAASEHFSKRINHSQHGTIHASLDEMGIAFFAAGDLDVGDELTFDYGEAYWIAASHAPAPGTDERSYTLRRLRSPHMARRVLRTAGPLWSGLVLPVLLPAVVCAAMLIQ